MNNHSSAARLVIIITLLTVSYSRVSGHSYGKGFFNHSGCLYAYLDGGNFQMKTADGDYIDEPLDLDNLEFDAAKTRCTDDVKSGKLVFSFKIDERTKIKLATLSMRITPSLNEGYWEISQANLTVTRADADRRRTFQLRVADLYAGLEHSYSCNEFTLHTMHKKKLDNETAKYEPRAKITLDRFQLQPFAELKKTVFGPSFDCSTWFSVPGITGLVLILFMATVTILGSIVLSKIETNDFKYSKEGLMFTQYQMEVNKRQ